MASSRPRPLNRSAVPAEEGGTQTGRTQTGRTQTRAQPGSAAGLSLSSRTARRRATIHLGPKRLFQLRCEYDAAFSHLYGISRADAGYILDKFPVVRRANKKAHSEYRTRRVILETYDALAVAAASGRPYVLPLPPPRRAG